MRAIVAAALLLASAPSAQATCGNFEIGLRASPYVLVGTVTDFTAYPLPAPAEPRDAFERLTYGDVGVMTFKVSASMRGDVEGEVRVVLSSRYHSGEWPRKRAERVITGEQLIVMVEKFVASDGASIFPHDARPEFTIAQTGCENLYEATPENVELVHRILIEAPNPVIPEEATTNTEGEESARQCFVEQSKGVERVLVRVSCR